MTVPVGAAPSLLWQDVSEQAQYLPGHAARKVPGEVLRAVHVVVGEADGARRPGCLSTVDLRGSP